MAQPSLINNPEEHGKAILVSLRIIIHSPTDIVYIIENSCYLVYIANMLTKTDLKQIQNVVKTEIKPLRKDIKTLKSDVSEIRKDVKTLINYFDREYLEIRARVERIEEHLNLEPTTP